MAAAAMADKGPLPGLRSLRLGGAYRLKDADLERLLACAPGLDQLRLPQCSLLQDAGCIPRLCPGIRCAHQPYLQGLFNSKRLIYCSRQRAPHDVNMMVITRHIHATT